MCGLVAAWAPNGGLSPEPIQAALDILAHRGPDGRGTYLSADRAVALGHTRLSVIDLDGGHQPIANETGRVRVVVNGEFYGFEPIRADLEARGHRFSTGSDSEILVHLYEAHGVDCLEHLRGEFAFTLWDADRRRLFAARDRFGVKPLCYAEDGGRLLLASEAKALFALGVDARWDETSLLHACRHQYLPPSRTLFAGVHQLPPGHLLLADAHGTQIRSYWDLDNPARLDPCDDREARDGLLDGLREAVRLRLRADVPVAFHLSGGLDSASTLALAAEAGAGPLHAFTVSFGVDAYDERRLAGVAAQHLGATLHPVEVSQRDLVDALPDAVWHSEGLAINGQLPAKLLLSRAVKAAGFKVTLSGEGADEGLLGYPHLKQDALSHGAPEARAQLQSRLDQENPLSKGVMLPRSAPPALPRVAARLGFVPTFLAAKAQFGQRLEAMLDDHASARLAQWDPLDATLAGVDVETQLAGRAPVVQSAYLWTRLALAGYILRTLGDGTEMASGVEGRVPFLDHEFFSYVRRLPVSQRLRNGTEKHVLREAMKGYLPEAIVTRPKHPFLAPPLTVFSDPDGWALLQDRLHSAGMAAVPLFDVDRVRRFADGLHRAPLAERAAAEPVLMTLLTASFIQTRLMERAP